MKPARERSTPWSIPFGSIAGVPVRVHLSFALIVLLFAFLARAANRSPSNEVLFVLLVFVCVVLHECGHALAARRYGIATREIVLYPFGGIARLERMPEGKAEIVIAIAGPLVNALLAAVLFATLVAAGAASGLGHDVLVGRAGLVQRMFVANVALFVFNLIPAFPMDGGRILRGALALALPPERATRIAAWVGQGCAVLFAAFGFLLPFPNNFLFLFLALFVFVGAGQEAAYQAQRALVAGRSAREAMITRFETLAPEDSLSEAARHLLATDQRDFPVLDAWRRVAGVLSRVALLRGLARDGREAPVLSVMEREPSVVPPSAPLEEVLRAVQSRPDLPVLVIGESGTLVGMVTLENLAEFIEVTRSTGGA
jgi:Zn-dependent protease/CBS domain-containing protein